HLRAALVVDADRRVDRLDVIRWADVAVRVGRMPGTPGGEIESIEVRDRRRGRGTARQQDRVRLGLFEFRTLDLFWPRLRQVAYVERGALRASHRRLDGRLPRYWRRSGYRTDRHVRWILRQCTRGSDGQRHSEQHTFHFAVPRI